MYRLDESLGATGDLQPSKMLAAVSWKGQHGQVSPVDLDGSARVLSSLVEEFKSAQRLLLIDIARRLDRSRAKRSASKRVASDLRAALKSLASTTTVAPSDLTLLLVIVGNHGHQFDDATRASLISRTLQLLGLYLQNPAAATEDHERIVADLGPTDCLHHIERLLLGAAVFDGVRGSGRLQKNAVRLASAALPTLCDSDGLPVAEVVSSPQSIRQTLAVLSRLSVASYAGKVLLSKTRERIGRMISKLSPLVATGDQPSLTNDYATAESGRSDETGVVLLNGSRRRAAVILFDNDEKRAFNFLLDGEVIISEWSATFTFSGQAVADDLNWREVCWFSDDESDYIELEAKTQVGDDQLTISRQVMLAKDDRLLYLAASLRSESESDVGIEQSLIAGPTCELAADPRDRCGWFHSTNDHVQAGRIVPVRCTMDRLSPSAATLGIEGDRLTTASRGHSRVTSSIAIDYSRKRRLTALEWYPLTVAEFGATCPPERAVASRLRVGGDQFLFYQSLVDATAPRTVLGMHTGYEAVFGRIDGGQVVPLVSVEAS